MNDSANARSTGSLKGKCYLILGLQLGGYSLNCHQCEGCRSLKGQSRIFFLSIKLALYDFEVQVSWPDSFYGQILSLRKVVVNC